MVRTTDRAGPLGDETATMGALLCAAPTLTTSGKSPEASEGMRRFT